MAKKERLPQKFYCYCTYHWLYLKLKYFLIFNQDPCRELVFNLLTNEKAVMNHVIKALFATEFEKFLISKRLFKQEKIMMTNSYDYL